MKFGILCASGLLLAAVTSSAETRVLQSFEGDGFGDWKVDGDGFGLAPVAGRCDGLTSEISGFSGDSLACSAHGGDKTQGTLESPKFKLTEKYVGFLVAGGNHKGKTAVQLVVDGKVEMEATGGGSLNLKPVIWDVSALKGKSAQIRIVDLESGGWGVILADHFVLTDSDKPTFPPTTHGGKVAPADLVASADIPGLTIPLGTKAKVIADYKDQGVTSPTALSVGEKGEIYVSETHRFRHGVPDNRDHLYWYLDDISSRTTEDRRKMHDKWKDKEEKSSLKFLTEKEDLVRVLSEPDASGVFKKSGVFAGKFNDVLDGPAAGVFAYEGTVFLACIPKVYALRDKDGDRMAEVRDVVQDGFGVRVSFSGHDLNGFVLGPDGRIYGTLGDRGMNIVTKEGVKYEMPDEGCVFRFDPDGTNFEVIHTGLRNPKEIAFDEQGNAISVDNNCDQGDQARVVYVVDGADSGWNMGHQGLLVHHRQMGMEERPPARWMDEKIWQLANPAQPAYILPPVAHITSGPSGLTYHPGTGFTEEEAGRFLICDYKGGAANSGIWSFKVEPKGASMKMTDSRKFNWGAGVTDAEYSWDGKLLVTDFITGWASHEAGRVYEVAAEKPWRGEEAKEAAALIKEGFEKRPVNELGRLLTHPDMRVRLRAELALTRKPDGLPMLASAAKQTNHPLARLHGVWGLGVIARRGAAVLPGTTNTPAAAPALRESARAALLPLLADRDVEVRTQAIKTLGESGLKADGIPFAKLISDTSPRVQLHAALAAGRLGATAAVPAICSMLDKTDDPYLRHAGSHALSLLENEKQLGARKSDSSARIRLAAVIALRRLKSVELAGFLNDADRTVSDEAVRSINDQNITAVRPLVAAMLDQPAPDNRSTMQWRRLLHSAFRTGDETNARRVLKVALDAKAPAHARKEAFRLLSEWTTPSSVDQSTGRMAPLPARNPELIRGVLNRSITPLVQTEGKFLDAALSLVLQDKLDISSVPDKDIEALVLNEQLPGAARADALDLYASRKPDGFDKLLVKLAAGKEDDLAIASLRRLVESSPATALDGLEKATTTGSAHRKQEAWKLAAGIQAPDSGKLFLTGLSDLQKQGGVSPAALELLDAAAKRTEPAVVKALSDFKAAAASSTDPLTSFLPSLEGGDAKKGEQIFESHPAGQCMRCHSGGHGGGDAGPNLSGVALRGDRRHFLQSMVEPGAKVAMGYGIASVTLKGGKSVAGIVIADTPEHVDLDSSGKVLRVMKSDVDSMTPPVSSMPPMGLILSAGEVRDLVAYLAEQKKETKDEKKRPAPELVKP
ncbi:HEAT repeat domain-containing protein [Luteolibacter yonseiensis]|uniref:HEAT repeat domain-containing protein n=1 Tax=Luteolibacter yonseiensis TaxID=1144680 RepID=A0A934R5C7_9BACT|nr:HEAT repeat domain-containing protein [Luteolibacter yonseiensis]MBK1817272.1 HEAT repeat domain-containing protein [Luteolibacter yonseiensis]